VVLAYMTVLDAPGLVPETWPDGRPISAALLAAVGSPGPGPVTEPPAPRYLDVLMHQTHGSAEIRSTLERRAYGMLGS